MGADTKIEWADHTANFWEGCTQISPACDNCYAKTRAERYGTVEWNGPPRKVAAGAKVVRAAQRIAIETGAKQFVFVNSLSDFFDNKADPKWRTGALIEMESAADCVFLLLTKRIGNVVDMMAAAAFSVPPENTWLGITAVNQEEADRDCPKLHYVKRALRIPRVYLSIEPMLGPMNIREHLSKGIDWVICGGESGKDARPMHPDWARSLRDQCATAGVPFMFKQWGEWKPCGFDGPHSPSEHIWADGSAALRVGKARAGRLLDGVEHNGRPAP